MNARAKFVLFPAALGMLCNSAPVRAGEPTEQIRAVIDQSVEFLNNSKLDTKKDRTQIVSRLRGIVSPLFDFEEMARRSLGAYWRRLDPKQQKEFVALFTELLEKTYADKIDLYDRQKVVYARETVEKNYAEVDTKVISNKGETFSVNYKLHRVDGRWKVYDVVVENISVVNNYRSQFQRIIVNSSFEDLMGKIKEKAG